MGITFLRLTEEESTALERVTLAVNAELVRKELPAITPSKVLHCIILPALERVAVDDYGEVYLDGKDQLDLPI